MTKKRTRKGTTSKRTTKREDTQAVQGHGFPVMKGWGFDLTFPDLVTALNLAAGVCAVYSAVTGEALVAVVLVAAGMLFDYFDGKIARAFGQSHAFGRELDSLADMVTFGLAPGVILLTLYPANDFILASAALYSITAAFRLARFNLLAEAKGLAKCYAGLPVPAAAFLLLGATFTPFNTLGIGIASLVVAVLMVSTIPVPKV